MFLKGDELMGIVQLNLKRRTLSHSRMRRLFTLCLKAHLEEAKSDSSLARSWL